MKKLPFWRRPFFARKILEVGGGHDPYSGVTHAVEKFPHDNYQRGGDVLLPSGASLFQGDLEALPFPEGERFDFLYASHVFEHVLDPLKAAGEINRVSRRGYLETPSPLREQLACPAPYDEKNDFHTLFCWSRGGVLHFIRKSERTVGQFPDTPAGRAAHALTRLHREEGVELEPLLSREAKTTRHFLSGGLRVREHADFLQAQASGACAYEASIARIRRDVAFPFVLRSARFSRLKSILGSRGLP